MGSKVMTSPSVALAHAMVSEVSAASAEVGVIEDRQDFHVECSADTRPNSTSSSNKPASSLHWIQAWCRDFAAGSIAGLPAMCTIHGTLVREIICGDSRDCYCLYTRTAASLDGKVAITCPVVIHWVEPSSVTWEVHTCMSSTELMSARVSAKVEQRSSWSCRPAARFVWRLRKLA